MAMPGLRIELPGVPDGHDADLDLDVENDESKGRGGGDEQASPAKRSRGGEPGGSRHHRGLPEAALG